MSRKKEEAMAAGISVAETKHNMQRRKPWHDYRRKGTYMLTLVVEGRKPLLGSVVTIPAADTAEIGAATATTPAASAAGRRSAAGRLEARVDLTELGRAIRDEEQQKIPLYYNMVEVWKLCIMPDHIHMIVRVKEDMPEGKHLGNVVAGFKGGCSRAWWRLMAAIPCADAQGVVANNDTQGVVAKNDAQGVVAKNDAQGVVANNDTQGVVPVATTPAASAAGQERPSLFEPGYNDLILIEDGQLDNWRHYLDDNPRRLAIKRLHPDYFTTLHYADIGEWHCQTVGNRFLLDIPQKAAVIVHNAYTDKEYADYKQRWLAFAEAGGILVSAAIATREKEVMREAMNRGYRLILVRENGFPPLYKPSGESFDACSDGRLLQVSPWEYHMQRRTISREQCLKLNRLVEKIVSMSDAIIL